MNKQEQANFNAAVEAGKKQAEKAIKYLEQRKKRKDKATNAGKK